MLARRGRDERLEQVRPSVQRRRELDAEYHASREALMADGSTDWREARRQALMADLASDFEEEE